MVGGPENVAILWVGGLENFAICAWVVWSDPLQVIAYRGNSASGWPKKNCNSAGGWSDKKWNSAGGLSEKSNVVTPTTNFFNGIALIFLKSSHFINVSIHI